MSDEENAQSEKGRPEGLPSLGLQLPTLGTEPRIRAGRPRGLAVDSGDLAAFVEWLDRRYAPVPHHVHIASGAPVTAAGWIFPAQAKINEIRPTGQDFIGWRRVAEVEGGGTMYAAPLGTDPAAPRDNPQCTAVSREGHRCQLPEGHRPPAGVNTVFGPGRVVHHAAHGPDGRDHSRWVDPTETLSAPAETPAEASVKVDAHPSDPPGHSDGSAGLSGGLPVQDESPEALKAAIIALRRDLEKTRASANAALDSAAACARQRDEAQAERDRWRKRAKRRLRQRDEMRTWSETRDRALELIARERDSALAQLAEATDWAAGWRVGVRWAAAEASEQLDRLGYDAATRSDLRDHLQLCASQADRPTAVDRPSTFAAEPNTAEAADELYLARKSRDEYRNCLEAIEGWLVRDGHTPHRVGVLSVTGPVHKLSVEVADLRAGMASAKALLGAYRPVVSAAKAWREEGLSGSQRTTANNVLRAAVDALAALVDATPEVP